ncbi:MAG TPA: hypothetical protein VLP43_07640 [Solirubrobacteraceae bacterium]|nr:hypothetical protein [Solirubrobacteraceae bacterium]
MAANLRNVLIIAALAALVAIVPGGGTGANVAIQIVSLAFLASMAWVAMLMYREHRVALYGLGDTRRAVLYGAMGVVTLTLTATHRLWQSAGGEVGWFLLLLAAVYAAAAVVYSARRY